LNATDADIGTAIQAHNSGQVNISGGTAIYIQLSDSSIGSITGCTLTGVQISSPNVTVNVNNCNISATYPIVFYSAGPTPSQ